MNLICDIKKMLSGFVAGLLLLSACNCIARTVRVSFYEYPGCHLQAADGTKSGYGYDFMQLLAAEAGWEVEYVAYDRPWGDIVEMMENGEIDIVDFVGWQPDRAEKMLFSARPMAYSGCSIRTTPENISKFDLGKIENWGHVRVGTLEGDQNELEFRNFAEDNKLDFEIIRYQTEEAGVCALMRGELDLVAYDGFAVTEDLRSIETYNPCRNHLVTRKDDVELMDEINAAMLALDQKQPDWMANLRAKYYPVDTVVAYMPHKAELGEAVDGYLNAILKCLNKICNAKIEIKRCNIDFSDADFSIPSFACGIFFSSENAKEFQMPRQAIGRLCIDLLALKGAAVTKESLVGRAEPLKIGYIRRDGVIFRKAIEQYAIENAIAYTPILAADSKELHEGLEDGRFDLVMRPHCLEPDLELVARCGSEDFFLAPPRAQGALAGSLSNAIKYLRMDEPEIFSQLSKRYFNAESNLKVVRFGIYVERGLSERQDDGTFSGLVADLAQNVAKRNGWFLVPVELSMAEAQRALASGGVDMVGALVLTPERAKTFDYSRHNIGPLYYALMTHGDGRMLENRPDTWSGVRIGVLQGSLAVHDLELFLAERNVEWQPVPFNNLDEGERQVREGRLDAVYTLANTGNSDLVALAMLPTKITYFCFNKSKPWIREQFDSALDEFIREDHRYIVDLYEKHLTSSHGVLGLDMDEIEFVRLRKGKKTVVSFVNALPPLLTVDRKTGKFGGFYPMLFDRISKQTGLEFEYRIGDTEAELFVDISNGGNFDARRFATAYWPGTPVCWVKRKNSPTEAKGIVALPRERRSDEKFVKRCGYRPLLLANFGACYEAVIEGRAEMTIDRVAIVRHLMNESKFYTDLQYQQIEHTSYSWPLALVSSTSLDPRFVRILVKARNSLREEERDAMLFDAIYSHRPASVQLKTLAAIVSAITVLAALVVVVATYHTRLARAGNRAKSAFLFNMSHDIRTPMNAIIGYTDIAIRHGGEPKIVDDCLNKIRMSSGHLLNLINDILEMSRIEAGRLDIVEKPLDILEATEGVKHMSLALAIPKSIDFKVRIGELRNRYIRADELHFNEVLINIISNAVKYTPNGGKVQYDIEQLTKVVDGKAIYRFSVSDSGIGMSEEFQKHLFKAFTRENSASVSKQEGTGLGLSIVKRIVDRMNGTINVVSKPGKGTTVTITVPFSVIASQVYDDYRISVNPVLENNGIVDLKGMRVLVVDDNEMNQEIAKEILEDNGLVVDLAEDGDIAVRKIAEKGTGYYPVVLMDIQMPVMNGYEATMAIRQLPGGEAIKIIALSANAFEEDKNKSLEAGMNAHVAKPIDVNVLFKTLRSFAG